MDSYFLLSLGVVMLFNAILVFHDEGRERGLRIIQLIVTAFFAMVMAGRPLVAPDTMNYVRMFFDSPQVVDILSDCGFLGKYRGIEYGFWYLGSVFRAIAPNPELFFFVTAFFNAYCAPRYLTKLSTVLGCRVQESVVRAIYISGFGMLYCAAAIRSGLSMTLGIAAVYFCADKKYVRSLLALLMAVWFHTTALVFALLVVLVLGLRHASSMNSPTGSTILIATMAVSLITALVDPMRILSSAIPSLFASMGMGEYGKAYLTESDQGGIGLTKLLTCLCLVVLVFACDRERVSVPVFFRATIYLTLCWIIVFADMRAASSFYDLCLVFSIPVVARVFVDFSKENKVWAAAVFAFIQLSLTLISFNTYFKFTQ